MDKRFIEEKLPLKEINLDSIVETSFKQIPKEVREQYTKTFRVKPMVIGPRLRNIHYWSARRPASSARALTLASLFY